MDPYLGEIKLFPFDFAPEGWASCIGQILNVRENQALFSVISSKYGGDGTKTFALPDMRGRTPVHAGPKLPVGARGGTASVVLTEGTMPAHTHAFLASPANGDVANPAAPPPDKILASRATTAAAPTVLHPTYFKPADPAQPGTLVALDSKTIQSAGSSGGHDNMQPYAPLHFCIAIRGSYPPRSES